MDVNPFVLFPKELWEMIMNYVMRENPVERSKDVLTLMHAYPVLGTEFPALKEVCLILQVLPFLDQNKYFEYNHKQILKQCRLFNKRWCRAVDTYLNSKTPEKVNHSYLNEVNFKENGKKSVAWFMEKMENHPASRNPFIANKRQIIVRAAPALWRMEGDGQANVQDGAQAQEKYMEAIVKMLEKYGKHIWNFSFEFDSSFFGAHNRPLLWANLDNLLQLLPNLRYFRLSKSTEETYYSDALLRQPEESSFRPYFEVPFPDLPRLEELTVSFNAFGTYQTEINLWTTFVHRYAPQLKKLELVPFGIPKNVGVVFKFVEMSPSVAFPELKTLVYKEDDYSSDSVTYFMDSVLSISAPKLEIIELELDYTPLNYENNPEREWKQLLQKLKRFPQLKRFRNRFCHLGDRDLSVDEDSLLALTDFSMYDDEGATYKMLLCFPNLEELEIEFQTEEEAVFLISKKIIRKEVETGRLFKNNIWEFLPKLKTFSFISGESYFEYRREEYEKLKEAGIDELDDHTGFVCSLLKYISDSVGLDPRANTSRYQTEEFDSDSSDDFCDWDSDDFSESDLIGISDSDSDSLSDEDTNGFSGRENVTDGDNDGVRYSDSDGIDDDSGEDGGDENASE